MFELKKQSRGAVLGWTWFFVKPLMYIFCFWFAIEVGMRASRTISADVPFILFLSAGLIPWFFMTNMLTTGLDVFNRYPYLVNKVKFPIGSIPHIYALASMIIQLLLHLILVVLYFGCGMGFDLYLLQMPVILVLMYAFWYFFSLLFSPLSAMSKDIKNLMAAMSTPLFWLSGILFDVKHLEATWIQAVMNFNPVTFFATAFRDALCDKVWLWEEPMMCIGFAIVFVITAIMAVIVYKRTNQEIADVL